MIVTHPFLFNAIVVIFVAITSGWIIHVINNSRVAKLKARIADLEKEKEAVSRQMLELNKKIEAGYTHSGRSSIISLYPPSMANSAN